MQLYTYARLIFPPYLSYPFCRFSIFVFYRFLLFSLLLYENERQHCLCYSAGIYFYGLLVIQSKQNCQIVEDVCMMTEQVVNSKDLKRQPRRGWPFFYKMREKYYRKSCKYMRNNSTKQKGKKISTSQYRSKFRAQRYGDKLPGKVGKP